MELPAERQIHWILKHSATLLELGAEPVRGLITPTGQHFPDAYDGSPKSVAALMTRVQEHAGLGDLNVELSIVSPEEGKAQTVSCSSGACGGTGKVEATLERVSRVDDGAYSVALLAGEVRSPVVVTTAMVRAVSFMFLTELEAYAAVPAAERDPLTDLAGTLLGFGVLLTNGSYLYSKGCGGVSVHSATKMPVEELALSLAIFCRLHDVAERGASKHLDLTQREAFEESYAWASSNERLVKRLESDPTAIQRGDYTLAPARSWLARTLGIGKKKQPITSEDAVGELERAIESGEIKRERTIDPAKAKRLAELRALVDESLDS